MQSLENVKAKLNVTLEAGHRTNWDMQGGEEMDQGNGEWGYISWRKEALQGRKMAIFT